MKMSASKRKPKRAKPKPKKIKSRSKPRSKIDKQIDAILKKAIEDFTREIVESL
jgi:hypothetical protein